MMMFLYSTLAYSENSKTGIIDTVREDGCVTVIFDNTPDRDLYYIISNDKIIGKYFHHLRVFLM